MAITQTNFTNNPGRSNAPSPLNIPDDPTKQSPQDKQKEKLEKDRAKAQKRYDDLNKKLEKFMNRTQPVTSKIREIAHILQSKLAKFNPNDDSDYLYSQISPILGNLRLRGGINKRKGDIEIFEKEKRGDDEYLYQVKIRRDETFDKRDIDKLNREKTVESLKDSKDGILLNLWGPYTLPVTEQEPQAPAPGTPTI